ncbi:helix-hairpin-helix domain-containing protein [Breznakiella homolactica]|uniref:RNA-binding transcriptional accessory protein n=1 Tax=Breznakiella homolactica TaxID=2798577 RepID=A0A7T8BBZ3_9SPIR|nr:Tex family protein [Breznakiella homolactica]QQO10595.1 RNA-binding transcriptional accessory protein [Breznakiella homolactica]
MELTQEFIDGLTINEVALMKRIAEQLSVNMSQVSAVIGLIQEGSTVPFIARYRKEQTGSLDEVQVRDADHLFTSGKNLETRRIEIIRGIFDQGKLTELLYENITKAATLTELEDIYAPYKRKKKTRGMAAQEKGLEPLAEAMLELDGGALRAKAMEFITENTENPELSVASADDALQGAMDIIAERISQDTDNRADVKKFYLSDGRVIVKGVGDEEAKKTSTYQMYWDYTEPLSQIKPHRVLAVNRGEREKVLDVTIDVDENTAAELLQRKYVIHNDYHKTAIEDGLKRLLSPAVIRELRGDQSDTADDHGISVFSQNLKNLLMQQPIKGTRVLGIDPGIRTGTKCAFLDDTGKYLGNFVIYNHKTEEAKRLILEGVKNYNVQLIAVGNGTGTKDVQDIVSQVISENNLDILYTVVDEDGASVYSASDIAREEFPELDLTIRGAISIGRRLQDPLAELVKIDPKSIGVGLYQHDLNQKKLSESLDEVVSSVVNNVGVNLNTASASLLKYVSGINGSLAKKIVKYRDEKGKIASREELTTVPGMGPKSFEQCAGFLKIPESTDPLDNTWVHPENYSVAREIRETITATGNLSPEITAELKEKHGVGETTINDIVDELKKPNRDPRDGYPKPVMQKGVITFEDLKEGMAVTGKIKNVVDFGAFVDLGIKETALVHISELSDHYIKDPMDVVKVGDVMEFRIISLDLDRRRIGLSRKSQTPSQGSVRGKGAAESGARDGSGHSRDGGKKRVAVVKKAGDSSRGTPDVRSRPQKPGPDQANRRDQNRYSQGSGRDDDGTMYNPFADALRKMQEKNGK